MNDQDIIALASLPKAAGKTNEALNAANETVNRCLNSVTRLENNVGTSAWESGGRHVYKEQLGRQLDSYSRLRDAIIATKAANVALAQIAGDLMGSFVGVFKTDVEQLKAVGGAAFTVASARDWVAIAQKLFEMATEASIKHAEDFQKKLNEAGNSSFKQDLIDNARAARITDWAQPSLVD
ncbi:hypothetical protein ACQBAR_15700 [Propionibacteriaceae bacterium Y1685]